jgi:hypothetical protein
MEQQASKGNSQMRFWKSEKLFLTFWISNPLPFHSMRMGGLPSTKYEKNKSKKKYNIQTEKRKTTDIQTKTRNKNHEFV